MLSRTKKLTLTVLCTLSLSGCINPGPHFLSSDNLSYNRAWNKAQSEQLLLNIIRDQYHEPQLYMVANSINSSGSYTPASIGDISSSQPFRYHFFREMGGAALTLPNISFSPSFNYSPETNGKFMTESLLPLKLKTLFYVIKTESSLGDIFRMTVQRMGPDVNFAYHSKNNQDRQNTQSIKKFIALTNALDDVYEQNGHQLYMTQIDPSKTKLTAKHHSQNALTLVIPRHLNISHQDWAALHTIGVTPHTRTVSFSNAISDPSKHIVRFSLRSLLGLTDFLAQGVDRVPNIHYRRLDQPLITNNLFEVHWSTSRPHGAYLTIREHGLWYFVKPDDEQTKIIFRLYRIFNDITQGDNRQTGLLIQT